VKSLGSIAYELKRRNHKVIAAVKNVRTAERHLAKIGVEFIQAPVWLGRTDLQGQSAVNYAELLIMVGYFNINQVAGQIRSWIHLLERIKPDIVLANHSPSVLLASRITGTKAMTVGTGFHSPPTVSPMPSLQPYVNIPNGRLSTSENKVLNTINQAICKCGGIPLTKLSDIFKSCSHYFLTLPEADHYGFRNNTRYWGVIQSSLNTAEPTWPKGDGPKVYVYMQHHSRPYQSLMESLQSLGWPSIIVSRNIDDMKIKSFISPNLTFSNELLNLEAVARHVDVVVTNCNHGTTVEMLQRGCRQLVIPLQTEQSMLAHRLSNQGLVMAGKSTLPCYRSLLERTNSDKTLKSNVKRFHETYRNIDPSNQLTALIDDIGQTVS
jgi:hypothetical protein